MPTTTGGNPIRVRSIITTIFLPVKSLEATKSPIITPSTRAITELVNAISSVVLIIPLSTGSCDDINSNAFANASAIYGVYASARSCRKNSCSPYSLLPYCSMR